MKNLSKVQLIAIKELMFSSSSSSSSSDEDDLQEKNNNRKQLKIKKLKLDNEIVQEKLELTRRLVEAIEDIPPASSVLQSFGNLLVAEMSRLPNQTVRKLRADIMKLLNDALILNECN